MNLQDAIVVFGEFVQKLFDLAAQASYSMNHSCRLQQIFPDSKNSGSMRSSALCCLYVLGSEGDGLNRAFLGRCLLPPKFSPLLRCSSDETVSCYA